MMSDTQQKRVDTRHQEMDGGQVYRVSLSEGVYGSWRAIGELEGLPSDGDIAQFLVTLYCSSGQQREGGEHVLRCGHCRCPLSLSCPACHPPPSPHPHLPPHPSLTSPHTPSLFSPPPSAQPPQILHTPDHESRPAADSERVVLNGGGDVKDEESDSTLQGDFDDCSPDLDTVKRESTLSRCDSDMRKRESAFSVCGSKLRTIIPQHVGAGVKTSSGDERRKSQRLARKAVTLCRGEKKRVAPFGHIEKSVKKKRHGRTEASADSHETSADGTYIKSEEEKTAGIHWQTENAINEFKFPHEIQACGGGRAFHCDQCHYRAFDARALSIHQRCLHSNERPFKCTYCPSAFARKFYLVVHLRKHTGEKPHRCTECSQSFAQKPSLTKHRRTRHGLDNAAHNKAAEPQTAASL
ncbi:hypothetical protein ACOMHN_013440 [Nucella lapillus]